MTTSSVEIGQVRDEQVPALREMMREYLQWAFSLDQRSADAAPTYKGVDEELRDLPGVFGSPQGRFLVAVVNGILLGAVALKQADATTCELKRLYVRPEARGQNIGYLLVDRLIEEAKQIGYKRMILDSHEAMTAAHSIYRKCGFRDVQAWEGFPSDLIPHVVFMERDL